MKVDHATGKLKRRREPVQHIAGQEAVALLNSIVDDCNQKIAAIEHKRQWYEDNARLLADESAARQAVITQQARRIAELESEIKALKKRVKAKGRRFVKDDTNRDQSHLDGTAPPG